MRSAQRIFGHFGGEVREKWIPAPKVRVYEELRWSEPGIVFSPAFWAHQVWLFDLPNQTNYRVGKSFEEEVVACLLGGFGIRYELAMAAFESLKDEGILEFKNISGNSIERVLRRKMCVNGSSIHYRFPSQKAKYIAAALKILRHCQPPFGAGPKAVREWLTEVPGIGPKTSAWIVRNWFSCDSVAILDIHIVRAGLLTGFFHHGSSLIDHYDELEDRFLRFAEAIEVSPAALDVVMWEQMRNFGSYALRSLAGKSKARE
jgi:thermostable 8-oxoguanine DNA glycosylase